MSAGTDALNATRAAAKVRLVHMAGMLNRNGEMSARCYKRPRPINLKRATWTTRLPAVTCPRCNRLARKARQEKGGRDG
jgi:hypothetical protein